MLANKCLLKNVREHKSLVEHLSPCKPSLLYIFSIENILLLMLLYSSTCRVLFFKGVIVCAERLKKKLNTVMQINAIYRKSVSP